MTTETTEQPRLDVKRAVQAAIEYVETLYPHEQLNDLRLEEVERTDDSRHWLITLGFSSPALKESAGSATTVAAAISDAIAAKRLRREYKQLKIDSGTGEVLSMKFRTP